MLTEPLEEVVDLLPHAQRPVLWHLEGLLRIAYLLLCHFLLVGAALRQLERLPRERLPRVVAHILLHIRAITMSWHEDEAVAISSARSAHASTYHFTPTV